jgi:hypothetical protein
VKGQEYTVMNYLVWAVFFVIVMAGVYTLFKTRIQRAVPTPVEQIFDIVRSAVQSGEVGISKPVCLERVYPGGSITITKKMIEKHVSWDGDVVFECKGTGCEATDEEMTIEGRTGTLCAEMKNDKLHIVWR